MNVSEVFRRIATHLNQAGIAHMLVGSFAATYYGASRSTRDIDIVIESNPDDLRKFVTALQHDNYYAELDWSRLGESHRQTEDVARVLRAQWPALDQAYLRKWIANLRLQEQWKVALRIAGITELQE